MAGAIVQSAYAVDDSAGNGTTIAVTLNSVAAGNLLDCSSGWGDIPGTITCTVSDGTSYTADAAGKVRDIPNIQASQNFFKPNSGSGNFTATATFSSNCAYRRIRLIEVSGLATASPEDKSARQTQTTPGTGADAVSSSATSATTQANDFVLGITHNNLEVDPGTGTVSAGTGFTLYTAASHTIAAVEYKSVSATGAQTATFTQSVNNDRNTHVIAFKEAASTDTLMGMACL